MEKEVEKNEAEKPINFSKQGKLNRAAGARFELKVRDDLEKMGWTVSKWMNTVDEEKNKIIPAKRKYNPFFKTMTIGTGFPDFVCFKRTDISHEQSIKGGEVSRGTLVPHTYDVIAVEVKTKGILSKVEKGMALRLLEHKIFSRILIARKKTEGRKVVIEYEDVEEKYKKILKNE